ncbi:MAG TPA: DUF6292 family protein [Pseudonocardiaceae bacterium]|nr:DUF6292 family protein [Pseudonocardiaceae bacterium]
MTEVLEPGWLDLTDDADDLVPGLRGYVALVAAALAVGLESCATDPYSPASAYIALDVRLSRYPKRDVALLWDERQGWSVCVETHSGEDLIVVAYLGRDLLAPPATVQMFVEAVVAGLPVGRTEPPTMAPCDRDVLVDRLRGYAGVIA